MTLFQAKFLYLFPVIVNTKVSFCNFEIYNLKFKKKIKFNIVVHGGNGNL